MSDFSLRVKKMPDEQIYSPNMKEEGGDMDESTKERQ
jgi:hypothetical protein